MIKNQEPRATMVGAAPKMTPANTMSSRLTKLPGAVLRVLAGPPMTERQRYDRDVAEARIKNYVRLSGWEHFR